MAMKILTLDGIERGEHYAAFRSALDAEWCDRSCLEPADVDFSQFDIALLSDEFNFNVSSAMRAMAEARLPSLHIVDGVIEWKNNWENPRSHAELRGMPLFQPMLSSKVACIGRSQARLLESWGSVGQCEVVGVPRFDPLLATSGTAPRGEGPWTLLIMTARTPGFTPRHIENTIRSLRDVKEWIEKHPSLNGRPIRPVWRITGGLADHLEIDNQLVDISGRALAAALVDADAVVTTPSTAMLEGMLADRPVALLDYNNCPHYIQPAWNIGERKHLDQVLPELQAPSLERRLFQRYILHDSLECHSPAVPRMVELIETMIRIGREARAAGAPLIFPRRILGDAWSDHHRPDPEFRLDRLYPGHPVFGNMDRVALQTEVGHLRLLVQDCGYKIRDLKVGQGQAPLYQQHIAALQQDVNTLSAIVAQRDAAISQLLEDLEQQRLRFESLQCSISLRAGRMLTWPARQLRSMARRWKGEETTGTKSPP